MNNTSYYGGALSTNTKLQNNLKLTFEQQMVNLIWNISENKRTRISKYNTKN